MITEKRFLAISPRPLIADGGADGSLRLSDTIDIKVGQTAILISNSQNPIQVKINRVVSNQLLYVGELDKPIGNTLDISAYLVADNAKIEVLEQRRTIVPQQEIERSTYDEEPVVARRVVPVDPYGQKYTEKNPFPVRLSDGSVNIGTVNAELEVQLSHIDNYPDDGDVADSVRIGDGTETLEINSDGSINVQLVPSIDSSEVVSVFGEAVSVPADTPTILASYSVVVDKQCFLHKVFVSGDNIAKYMVKINNDTIDVLRTYFGGSINGHFDFSYDLKGVVLISGDVVTVEVNHSRPHLGDFNARIQIIEV